MAAAAEAVAVTVGGWQLVEYPSAPVEGFPWRWRAFLEGRLVATGVFCAGPLTDPGRLADVLRLALAVRQAHGAERLDVLERDPERVAEGWRDTRLAGCTGAEVDLSPGGLRVWAPEVPR